MIEKDDILIIHDTGAHGIVMGSNYNGKLKSKELLVHKNGDIEMIRRAETISDFMAAFV